MTKKAKPDRNFLLSSVSCSRSKTKKTNTDIKIEDCGTIVMITPISRKGKKWVKENMQYESWQALGNGIASDPRMAQNVIEGMKEARLKLLYSGFRAC